MRLFGEPLRNMYQPQTKGFRIYYFGNDIYCACRTIERNTITAMFRTLDECYAFLKGELAIVKDETGGQESPLGVLCDLMNCKEFPSCMT